MLHSQHIRFLSQVILIEDISLCLNSKSKTKLFKIIVRTQQFINIYMLLLCLDGNFKPRAFCACPSLCRQCKGTPIAGCWRLLFQHVHTQHSSRVVFFQNFLLATQNKEDGFGSRAEEIIYNPSFCKNTRKMYRCSRVTILIPFKGACL